MEPEPGLPEPWLRGPLSGVHPFVAPVLRSLQHAREDLARHADRLTTEQIWAQPHGFGSVGFHIRHIAESTSRLVTYLEGKELSNAQLTALNHEHEPGATRKQLVASMEAAFAHAELVIRAVDPARLAERRTVGRKHLPTTVMGLLVHLAEHTQRHLGQAISAAKLAGI